MVEPPVEERESDSNDRTDGEPTLNRRRVLRSGAAATVASAVGLGSAVGSVAASRGDGSPEVVRRTASRNHLNEAGPLLRELAAEGLLSRADGAVFPDASLSTNDSGSAVLGHGGRVVHTFVIQSDGTKLTVNVPENGNPYALYAPDGADSARRVHYEQVGGTVESTAFEYETKDVTAQACVPNCSKYSCMPAASCTFSNRQCEEICVTDSDGSSFCYEDCCCCC